MGTVLHSHAFAALRADTCICLLGVQAENSDQAVPICGDLAVADQSLLQSKGTPVITNISSR